MTIKPWKKILAMSFVYIMLAITYLPIIVLIIFSFTKSRVIGVWSGFTWELYAEVFRDSEIISALINTLVIAVISASLATLLGTISAIGIHYLKRRLKNAASTINQITVVNADVVTAVAFMMFFLAVGIPGGYVTLVITHTIITMPYVILAVLPRLRQLNPNTYEAGLDLGAGHFKVMFSVIMPQLIPAMISGFFMAFTLSLDDFLITNFNNGWEIETISIYLYTKLTKSGVKPVLRALSSLIFVVSMLVLVGINVYSKKRNKSNPIMAIK